VGWRSTSMGMAARRCWWLPGKESLSTTRSLLLRQKELGDQARPCRWTTHDGVRQDLRMHCNGGLIPSLLEHSSMA